MRVVILAENESQDQEVVCVKDCLKYAGCEVDLAGPVHFIPYSKANMPKGKHGITFKCDRPFDGLKAEDYDAVIISGGWGAERLRRNEHVLRFVREMHTARKVVAAICHGPWVLCSVRQEGLCDAAVRPPAAPCVVMESCDSTTIRDATMIRSRRMTCYPGCKDDLINAGGEWVDERVVVDDNVVTAQHYDDVPEFCKAIMGLLA